MAAFETSDPPGTAGSGPRRDGAAPARRGPRRSREELRALILDAGRDLVRREGLGTAADHLSFTRVFARIEETEGIRVTHSSVIGRVWPNIDAYRLDVLEAAGVADTYDVWPDVGERVAKLLTTADRSTPEARAWSLSELCRIAGVVTLTTCLGSAAWRNQVAIWVLALTDPPGGRLEPVRRAITDRYPDTLARACAVYDGMSTFLGYRLRAHATAEEFAVSANALIEGCAIQVSSDPAAVGEVMLPGPDGEPVPWSYVGIGFHALVNAYYELDPGWMPDRAPTEAPGPPPPRAPAPRAGSASGERIRDQEAPATRRPRAALRRLLVDAGVDFLTEEGLGAPADSITFKRAFDHLERTKGVRATHASVIGRIWADQQQFRRDVLVSLADHDGGDTMVRTGEAVTALLATFDLSTPELRRAALRELVRVGSELELTENTTTAGWRERTAVWAVGTTAGRETDEEIAATLRGARRRMFLGYVDLYGVVLDRLGLRVRAPFTTVELVRVSTALSEGCNHRALVGVGPSAGLLRPTGPGGALQEWTLFGIGLDALIDTFTEPVPAGAAPG